MLALNPQTAVYTTTQVRQLDNIAIQQYGIAGYDLMCRAGQAAFEFVKQRWPSATRLCVLCGAGNNAGDGYVVARLAQQAGFNVTLVALSPPQALQGDAQRAYQAYQALKPSITLYDGTLPAADVYIDALLGTGLTRALEGAYLQVVQQLNQQFQPILALDIPSGLNGDTGQPLGDAVQASATITFIAWKQGLLTGQARHYCGELSLDLLMIPPVYAALPTPHFILADDYLRHCLPKRKRTAHKGNFGHSVLVGGAPNMSGAIQLAGKAALRTGSGLVSIITHSQHAEFLNLTQPELMVLSTHPENVAQLTKRLHQASAIGCGPGLGQTEWSQTWFEHALQFTTAKVLDADALNLLAQQPNRYVNCILTPHPAEAARLLKTDTASIETDRVAALMRLQREYGGVIILKGAGTLVTDGQQIAFCVDGNPGMASGGMGDLLTGIVTALLAQGFSLFEAAALGVFIHARAGDLAAQHGERGLVASDMLGFIRTLVNP